MTFLMSLSNREPYKPFTIFMGTELEAMRIPQIGVLEGAEG